MVDDSHHPIERASLNADRSFTGARFVKRLVDDIAEGYATCARCVRRRATGVADIRGSVRAVCGTCKDDQELDDRIARQKQRRAAMARR